MLFCLGPNKIGYDWNDMDCSHIRGVVLQHVQEDTYLSMLHAETAPLP